MSCKITTHTISKLVSSLTSHFDSAYEGKPYNITGLSVEGGCDEVANFLSSIYRVKVVTKVPSTNVPPSAAAGGEKEGKVVGEERSSTFICKSSIVNSPSSCSSTRDNLEKYYWNVLFTKEKIVYDYLDSVVRKELLGLLGWKLFPDLHHYYSEGEDYSCLILDDLSLQYYMPASDNDNGTDDDEITFDECATIMKGLARLHVISLVAEEKLNESGSKYELCSAELLFSREVEPALKALTYNSFQGVLKLAEKYRPDDLFPALNNGIISEGIWDQLCELVKRKSTFSCLCHGDPRLRNVFISKEKMKKAGESCTTKSNDHNHNRTIMNEDIGLRFIDFQLTRYASPITDLQYALFINYSRRFREKYTGALLEIYYKEFQSLLGQVGDRKLKQEEAIKLWTFEKLKEEYEAFSMYGFLVSLVLLPMILLSPGDIDKSISQMTEGERTKFFKEDRAELILNIGSKNEVMRKRIFDLCDEMVVKKVI